MSGIFFMCATAVLQTIEPTFFDTPDKFTMQYPAA
jgi:hypothetical protein